MMILLRFTHFFQRKKHFGFFHLDKPNFTKSTFTYDEMKLYHSLIEGIWLILLH